MTRLQTPRSLTLLPLILIVITIPAYGQNILSAKRKSAFERTHSNQTEPFWGRHGRLTFGFQFGSAFENNIPHDFSHINMYFAEPSVGFIVWDSPHSHLPLRRFELLGEGLFGGSAHPGGDLYGGALDFRFDFLPVGRIVPYVDAGSGPVHTTIDKTAPEISGGTQFLSQAGAGVQYFFEPQHALLIEYHYFHMSNAGIQQPNFGFNGSMVTIGFRWLRWPHPIEELKAHRRGLHLPHFW